MDIRVILFTMMMIVASLSGCLGSGGTMHEGATDTIDSWDGACDESCAECDSGSELDCTVCPNGTSMVDVDNDGAGECISDDSNGTNNSTNMTNDSWDGTCHESCSECDDSTENDCTVCPSGTSMVDNDNDGAGECIPDNSGNETTDGGNETTDVRTWGVVDLNNTMLQEGAISGSECGVIYAYPAWSGAGMNNDAHLRNEVSNLTGTVIDIWIAVYEEPDSTVVIPEIKTAIDGFGDDGFILVENGNISGVLDFTLANACWDSNMTSALNDLMDHFFGNSNSNSCGDGVIDSNEECDDGNSDDGDGCSSNCTQEDDPNVCEDGEQEERDDGCTYNCVQGEWQQGSCDPPDSDGDGVWDGDDAFPNDANETDDSDGDGVGDNADQCPNTTSGATIDANGCEVSQAQEHFIDISGMAFSPDTITISVGDTITWTNQDGASHTATGDNSEFDSGTLGNGQSFSFTFTAAGTYTYHCAFHSGMTATIIVQ